MGSDSKKKKELIQAGLNQLFIFIYSPLSGKCNSLYVVSSSVVSVGDCVTGAVVCASDSGSVTALVWVSFSVCASVCAVLSMPPSGGTATEIQPTRYSVKRKIKRIGIILRKSITLSAYKCRAKQHDHCNHACAHKALASALLCRSGLGGGCFGCRLFGGGRLGLGCHLRQLL